MYLFSLFLTGAVFLLILAGGLVTSHQAGLAVPDWPLSYGQAFPPMVGNVFWEHGHRMIAGTVGILTLILALWIQMSEKRSWIKKLAWTAFGAVVLQAVLGGLTVLYLLPAPISILHACLAQTFFCLVIAITFFLRPGHSAAFNTCHSEPFVCHPERPSARAAKRPSEGSQGKLREESREILRQKAPQDDKRRAPHDAVKLKRLSYTTVGVIYAQLILGATVRHTSGGHAVVAHVLMAFAVVVHVCMLAGRVMRLLPNSALFKPAVGLEIFTMAQFFLGIGSFVLTRMVEQTYAPSKASVLFTAVHQTNGAAILGTAVLIALIMSR